MINYCCRFYDNWGAVCGLEVGWVGEWGTGCDLNILAKKRDAR